MKNIYNSMITSNELQNELINFSNNNSYQYCSEVYDTALWLNKENEKRFRDTGKYWFIPRALIPIAFEAWWQLQHNIDSYGCDYNWIYSDGGMTFVLIQDCQCDINWWGETEEDFIEYFNLDI